MLATRPHLAALALLALPYLVGIVALDGLTEQLRVFHGTDEETYHVPIILQFAEQWPAPDLVRYPPSSTTPGFHVVWAAAGKLLGYELWRLRLLDVLVAYAGALVAYALLLRRGIERPSALLLTGLLALSPYVLGPSFLVLTDAFGFLLALGAIAAFDRVRAGAGLKVAAAGALLIAAALLTRQSYAWLCPLAGILVLAARALSPRAKLVALGSIALATVPLWTLVAAWGGLVPPNSDPAACGLCESGGGSGFGLRAPLFTLAILGFYGALLRGREVLRHPRAAAAGAALALAALLVQPLSIGPRDEGYLWNAADRFPEVLGSSLLLLGLVPLGGAVLGSIAAGRRSERLLPLALAATFLAFATLTGIAYQKYFDPFALLIVLLAIGPGELRAPLPRAGAAVLAVAFLTYVFLVPPPDPPPGRPLAQSALEPIDRSVTMGLWLPLRRTPPIRPTSSPSRSPKPPVRPSGSSLPSASSSSSGTSSST